MQQVLVHFDFPADENANKQNYDAVWDDLRAAGHANPKGLIFHAGAPKPGGGWIVIDVWESAEAFQEFGKVLMPIIQKHKLPEVQPNIYPAHYIYQSK